MVQQPNVAHQLFYKVLLEDYHAHSLHTAYSCLHITMAELSSFKREHTACKRKYLLSEKVC